MVAGRNLVVEEETDSNLVVADRAGTAVVVAAGTHTAEADSFVAAVAGSSAAVVVGSSVVGSLVERLAVVSVALHRLAHALVPLFAVWTVLGPEYYPSLPL